MRIGISYKTLAQLRAFTAEDVRKNNTIYLTDEGKEGEWVYDSSDTTSADNIGTILVTTSGGFRYKRKYKGDVYASWFIDTADTSGTSGNRERNAIHRAYTFVAAQTKPQTVILDNSRIWYVNNDAIYLNIATGKKITIKGEGNPVIDFLCSGGSDLSNDQAVFRTANSYTYPGTGGSAYTASVSGTTMTVTAVASGTLKVGQLVYGTTISASTYIVGAITGTGGTGTYILNKSQTVSSATHYSKEGELGWTNGVRTITYGKIEIKGITFDGSRNPANSGSATVYSRPLFFRSCQQVNILNNTFQNIPGSGVAIGASDGGTVRGNTFRAVFARESVNDAIGDSISIYAYCKNIRVVDNDISLATGESARCGISVDDYCKNSTVVNNTIIGYERAIHIETSKGVVTTGNTIERSPIGILSGQNTGCHFADNFIDGRNPVFGATLGGVSHIFVYLDEGGTYDNNTVIANKLKGELDFLAKFWGEKLIVKNNKFRWIHDHTNQVKSQTSNTIANTGSKTFTYIAAIDLVWEVGDRIRAFVDDFNYMEGAITSVSSTSVTFTADASGGAGTSTAWTLRYAPTAVGSVYGSGYNNDNEYSGNTFEYSNLELDDTQKNIVKGNIFKSSYVVARNTTSITIKNNEFIPFTREIYSKSISAYGSINTFISQNTFTNPTEYVVDNGTTTGLICEDNTFIRTDASSTGNGYWYVNSNLADTNINRTVKPNIIRDFVNTNLYFVDNHGVAYEIDYATPEMFGARLNDSTYNSGAAINAAIQFKNKVKLRAGTYYTSDQILINKSDFTFEGAGMFATIIKPLAAFDRVTKESMVRLGVPSGTKPNNITAKGISFRAASGTDGNDLSAVEAEIEYNLDFEDCWFQGGNYTATARNVGGINIKQSKHLRFHKCNFTNSYSYAVLFSGAAYDSTSFTDCDFDESQGDVIVTTAGYIQSGIFTGCKFGQSYVPGSGNTPIQNTIVKNTTSGGINEIAFDNCTFNTLVDSTSKTAIDIVGSGYVSVQNCRFSYFKRWAIIGRSNCVFDIKDNKFSNCGYVSTGAYTTVTTNPDTTTYIADVYIDSAFYGGRLESNRTDRADGIIAIVEPTGSDLQYQNMEFLNNKTYSYGLVWGTALKSVGNFDKVNFRVTATTDITFPTTGTLTTLAGSEVLTNKSVNGVTLVSGGSATQYLNGQGNYVSISGGGDALTTNPLSQFAATTSLQLKNTISDETGSGSLVFATSPTLVTPVLGVASATSINGLTITSSTGFLTITNAKTLSVSNTLTFTGIDSTTLTFQGTDTYVGRTTTDTLTNKRITARVQSTASTATFTYNFDNDDIGIITAQATALTMASPSGTPTQGQPFVMRIKDNGTARTITWNAIFRAIGITLPTTTVVSKTMYISGYYNTTDTKIDVVGYAIEA